MTVAKIIEVSARSSKSFEAAIQAGIDRVNDSVDQVSGVWIQDQKAVVKNGKISDYQVTMKVTFVVSPSTGKRAVLKKSK